MKGPTFDDLTRNAFMGFIATRSLNNDGPDEDFVREFRKRLIKGVILTLPVPYTDDLTAADYLCQCHMQPHQLIIEIVVLQRQTEPYRIHANPVLVESQIKEILSATALAGLTIKVSHGMPRYLSPRPPSSVPTQP